MKRIQRMNDFGKYADYCEVCADDPSDVLEEMTIETGHRFERVHGRGGNGKFCFVDEEGNRYRAEDAEECYEYCK